MSDKADAESKEEAIDAGNGASDKPPARSLLFRLQQFGYRKFPSVIPNPRLDEDLAYFYRKDEEENAKTEPPADEKVQVRCIWAVEFYTPSQTAELLRCFEKLGWNVNDPTGLERNPSLWVQQDRASPHGGGWMNLGPLHRTGDKGFYHHGRSAPLPAGVEYVIAKMYSLTSSITCIVACFILEEDVSQRFERALRQRRRTFTERTRGRGYRYVQPDWQKKGDIKTIRSELRALASDWFKTHLPGLFSGGVLAGEFPTAEFLTLDKTAPFPSLDDHDRKRDEWFRLLDIGNDVDAWASKAIPGLKIAWPLSRHRDSRFHAIIAARDSDFSAEELKPYGDSRNARAIYTDQLLNDLLSHWALLGVLSAFEGYLNKARDSAAFDPKQRANPLALLKTLGGHVAQSVDIAAAAADLQRFARQKWRFSERHLPAFHPCEPRFYKDKDITLGEALRQDIAARAKWLHSVDQSVRDLLVQYGTTVGTWENIKVQRQVAFLTWVVVVLTVLIAILTAVTLLVSMKAGNITWPW